ncbi:MAG TPA: quinone-dependent dihydroorotate dehydrogenase, partial [Labilithrix sp.]
MYALLKPLLFRMDPAKAHKLAMSALGAVEHVAPLRAGIRRVLDPRLSVRAMGIDFPSPIGLAGGFDKNAERAVALASLGFGHLELGTVTALAQEANPTPNLFRLSADRALVNRLGFPNEGAAVVAARIAERKSRVGVPVGVSIGKSRAVAVEDAIEDYLASFRAVSAVADFVVVNVSSPNTKDLRALQAADAARALFDALAPEKSRVPILVKIAPDLADDAIDAICDAAREAKLAGVVATNTTIAREGLATPADVVERIGAGGLSGRPLRARSLAVVRRVRDRVGTGMCVIGVGGIDSADAALEMMRAGADLVQLYTAFVYEGPLLPRRIARDL